MRIIVKRIVCALVVISLLMIAFTIPSSAVVSCGSSSDGYRCHTNSTDHRMYHTLGDKKNELWRRGIWIKSSLFLSFRL